MFAIDVFIMAGGRGKRINKYTKKTQKCMLEVNSKPFLQYQIEKIYNNKYVNKIYILASYKSKKIEKYFKNFIKIEVKNEKKRSGTYGALLKYSSLSNQKFLLIMNGDTFVNYNFNNFFKKINNIDILLLTKKITNGTRYGSLIKKKNRLIKFNEKKQKKNCYINLGIALIKKKIIKKYSNLKIQSIENELFSKANFFKINVKKTNSFFIDIGTYQSLKFARKYF